MTIQTDAADRRWQQFRERLEAFIELIGGFGEVDVKVTFHRGLPTILHLTQSSIVARLDAEK